MAVLVGIDEAGYGPLLGPLVVTMFALEIPDKSLPEDHWQLLKDAVSKNKKNLKGRLLITDSKKVYNRKTGLLHLQNTVLAVMQALGHKPESTYDVLKIICPTCLDRIVKYKWYGSLRQSTIQADWDSVSISASVLNKTLQSNDFKILEVKSVCYDVGHYNKMITKLKNKSAVLFTPVCNFISDMFNKYGDRNLQIIVDRQGGRVDYVNQLMSMFQKCDLEVIRQDSKLSSYRLSYQNIIMKIHFAVKADLKYMPVCISSMFSKYIREILVNEINSHFIKFNNSLRPTAGYWTDGQRFVKELIKHCPSASFDHNMLIRIK